MVIEMWKFDAKIHILLKNNCLKIYFLLIGKEIFNLYFYKNK